MDEDEEAAGDEEEAEDVNTTKDDVDEVARVHFVGEDEDKVPVPRQLGLVEGLH